MVLDLLPLKPITSLYPEHTNTDTLNLSTSQHVYFGLSTDRKQCGRYHGRVATELLWQNSDEVHGHKHVSQTKGEGISHTALQQIDKSSSESSFLALAHRLPEQRVDHRADRWQAVHPQIRCGRQGGPDHQRHAQIWQRSFLKVSPLVFFYKLQMLFQCTPETRGILP
jgi:hypothetical protein